MSFVNLTPHTISLQLDELTRIDIPSSGVCRVESRSEYVGELRGLSDRHSFPIYRTVMGKIEGLPDRVPGVCYIVSSIVLSACDSSRSDVFAPGTGPNDGAIRDEKGQIKAVTRLIGK